MLQEAFAMFVNISEGLAVCLGLIATVLALYWGIRNLKQQLGGPAE